MDLAAVRSLVREANFGIHGVPAVLTPPGSPSVDARIIWADRETPPVPGEGTFQRVEPRRQMAIPRDALDLVPRGTLVAVTEHLRVAPSLWRVDATTLVEPDHVRVLVVEADPLLADLFGYWTLDEEAGNTRRSRIAGPPLLEVGGAVPSILGRRGRAASHAYASPSTLRATITGIDLSAGFTVSLYVRLGLATSGSSSGFFEMWQGLGDYAGTPIVNLFRLPNTNDIRWSGSIPPGGFPQAAIGLRLTVTVEEWHLVTLWVDPAGTASMEIDGGAQSDTRNIAGPGLAAFAPDTLNVGGPYLASLGFNGAVDELMLWPRLLSTAERARIPSLPALA